MYVGVHLFYLGGVGGRRLTVAETAIGSMFGARGSRVMAADSAREMGGPRKSACGGTYLDSAMNG